MIIIDGMVFSLQGHGGVSVYIHQLLRHLSREGHATECLVEEPLQQQLENTPPGIEIVRRTARRLERYRSCRVFNAGSIFHTSYYRRCADRRIPSVVTVYDFVYERWFGGPGLWVHREQKRAAIRSAQAVICISQRPQRLVPLVIDLEIYKCRHLIENFFCKLKEFKRIAMRADKTDTSFKAMIYAVAALINSR